MEIPSKIGVEDVVYVCSFIVFALERILSYIREKRKKKISGAKSFEKTWLLNESLYPLLYDLMMEYNSIRAFIVQFHNGEQFYSGQSIQKMTCSHEVKRPGIRGVKHSMAALPVDDETHRIIADIRSDDFYCIENAELEQDADLKEKLFYLGVKSKYCFGIHDQEGRITGVLYLHFNYLSAVRPDQIQGIKMTVNQISNLLTTPIQK